MYKPSLYTTYVWTVIIPNPVKTKIGYKHAIGSQTTLKENIKVRSKEYWELPCEKFVPKLRNDKCVESDKVDEKNVMFFHSR